MRLWHSILLRSAIVFAVSACFAGTGPVIIGVNNGGGGATTGAARVLSFFSQPSSANVGQILPAVQVVASDSLGSTDTTFTGSVSVALASNSSSGALSGTLTRRAARGIASFNDLRIDRAGTYTLRASTANAAPVVSAAFTITTPTTP
jgi:hypothetical protein